MLCDHLEGWEGGGCPLGQDGQNIQENVSFSLIKTFSLGFPGGAVVENPPANAGDTGSSPGPGRSHMPRSN